MRSTLDDLAGFQLTGLRVALGLGDQELEQRLRPALEAASDLRIIAQCLAADQLLELVQSQQVDVLVVAWTLHRLTEAVVEQLERPGVTLVMLVQDPAEERWMKRGGPVLRIDSEPDTIHEAVVASRPGGRCPARCRLAGPDRDAPASVARADLPRASPA